MSEGYLDYHSLKIKAGQRCFKSLGTGFFPFQLHAYQIEKDQARNVRNF